MASDKNLNSNESLEDSNIDQINNFVNGSDEETSNTLEPENSSSDNSDEIVDLEAEKTEEENDPDSAQDEVQDEESKSDEEEEKPVSKNNSKPKKTSENNNSNKKPEKKLEQKHLSESKSKPVEKKKEKPLIKKEVKKPEKKESKKESLKTSVSKKPEKKELKKMDKKDKHKSSKHEGNGSKTKTIIMWTVIGLLAIILIVALILISKNNSKEEPKTTNTDANIAATVNGYPIYTTTIMNEYNRLSPMMQQVYTLEMILNKSIDDLLLYQEAENEGIKISDEEIQSEIDALKKANMLSDEEFKTALENQNLTLEDVEELIKRNLYIRELLNKTVLQDIEVTDKEIENYYEDNIVQFETAEQVTVQHILVMITDTVTDAQAKEKIDNINSELTNDNFCDLVTKYSEDPGSVANCGKYTFAKGDFNNPEFENPSFDLKVGEKTIVKTVFGYHLIKKLENIPAGTKELSEVKDQIEKTLHDSRAQEKFDALLERLRTEAEIVNYLSQPSETAETSSEQNSNVEQTVTNLDAFAQCLTEKGAKFYGAYWCPHCQNQKELFGESVQYITYVECAVEDQPQVQTAECTDAEISGYPTWVINGKYYPGEQSLERLATLTGCSLK